MRNPLANGPMPDGDQHSEHPELPSSSQKVPIQNREEEDGQVVVEEGKTVFDSCEIYLPKKRRNPH